MPKLIIYKKTDVPAIINKFGRDIAEITTDRGTVVMTPQEAEQYHKNDIMPERLTLQEKKILSYEYTQSI